MSLDFSIRTCKCLGARLDVNHNLYISGVFQENKRAHSKTAVRGVHRKPRRPLPHIGAESQLQELIVGGAVLTAVTAAFVNGLKGEPKGCDLCQGVGGTKCFACDGSGTSQGRPENKLAPGGLKRDFVGRVPDPQACRVCGGSGTNLCSKCKGSGYLSSL